MKTTLNLATPPGWREQYGFRWAVPTTLAALAGLVLLGHGMTRNYRRYQSIEKQVSEVRGQEGNLKSKLESLELQMEAPEYRQMFQDTRLLNELITARQYSILGLAARVSALLPHDVRLDSLAVVRWHPEKGSVDVRLGIEGKDEKGVETFLTNLEGAPDFSDVVVRDTGVAGDQNSSGGTNGNVLLMCTAHFSPKPVGGAQ